MKRMNEMKVMKGMNEMKVMKGMKKIVRFSNTCVLILNT
jgi:hypothetical protein